MSLMSVLTPVSIGYALQNLTPGERVLEVMPVEHMPGVDGEVTSAMEELEVNGIDPEGNAYSMKSIASTGISATWLPFGSNRVTPPDIRRKERVIIYRFADEDRYYWKELGLDDAMRRLETVIYAWNGNPESSSEDVLDISKCYFFEVSPRTKNVTFQTARANGEPFAYTMQIDTEEGRWTMTDDKQNFVEFDSTNTEFRAHNAVGTYFEMVKKKIVMFAPDSVQLVGVNSFKIETKVMEISASTSVSINTPITKISGDVEIAKNLKVVGSIQAASISAPQMTGGSMTGGTITCQSITAQTYNNLPG